MSSRSNACHQLHRPPFSSMIEHMINSHPVPKPVLKFGRNRKLDLNWKLQLSKCKIACTELQIQMALRMITNTI